MDQPSSVGIRLLEVRQSHGLSLRALAARSGLSINAISRIEREESSPTVASLQRLAGALDVPLVELFRVAPERATVVVRRGEGLKSRSGGVLIESLGAGLRGQRSGPFLMTLEPLAWGGEEPIQHEGEEFVHCLEGDVEYTVGTGRHRLVEGDSLLFLAKQPHRCRNLAERAARLLIVILAPQGDIQATQQRHLMISEE
jgi:transcriptional regulator with XRE-family HTH domain